MRANNTVSRIAFCCLAPIFLPLGRSPPNAAITKQKTQSKKHQSFTIWRNLSYEEAV